MQTETEIKELCSTAGAEFIGLQGDQYILFRDLLTKSTLAIEKKGLNSPKLQAKIAQHRAKYPKDLEMTAYIIDALNFIVKKYHVVPKNVITQAANNAAITIQNFLKEQNETRN